MTAKQFCDVPLFESIEAMKKYDPLIHQVKSENKLSKVTKTMQLGKCKNVYIIVFTLNGFAFQKFPWELPWLQFVFIYFENKMCHT